MPIVKDGAADGEAATLAASVGSETLGAVVEIDAVDEAGNIADDA